MKENNASLSDFFKASQKTLGYYSANEYKIRLHMTIEDYYEALDQYKDHRIISANLQTILHEYCHWLQSMTTVYGIYQEWMHYYSTALLDNITQYIVKTFGSEIPIIQPIISVIEKHPPIRKDPIVKKLLYKWIDCSLANCYLNADFFAYMEYKDFYASVRGSAFDYLHMSNILCQMDQDIAGYIRSLPDSAFDYKHCRNYLYHREDREFVYRQESAVLEFKISASLSTRSLYESFATVFEWSLLPEKFCTPPILSKGSADYFLPISMLESRLSVKSKEQLLKTCLAIFDVVFSPPIHPLFSCRRGECFDLNHFDLCTRFMSVFYMLPSLGPAEPLEDWEAYEERLCAALGWPTPMELAGIAVSSDFFPQEESVTAVFKAFQKLRQSGFSPLVDGKAFLEALIDKSFTAPIMQLNDQILINHGINDEVSFNMNCLMRQFINQVFAEDELKLYAPYPVSQMSLDMYKDSMTQLLSKSGIDVDIWVLNPEE